MFEVIPDGPSSMATCADSASTPDLATTPWVLRGLPVYCKVELMKMIRAVNNSQSRVKMAGSDGITATLLLFDRSDQMWHSSFYCVERAYQIDFDDGFESIDRELKQRCLKVPRCSSTAEDQLYMFLPSDDIN